MEDTLVCNRIYESPRLNCANYSIHGCPDHLGSISIFVWICKLISYLKMVQPILYYVSHYTLFETFRRHTLHMCSQTLPLHLPAIFFSVFFFFVPSFFFKSFYFSAFNCFILVFNAFLFLYSYVHLILSIPSFSSQPSLESTLRENSYYGTDG
jgi:hypothetical protein